MARTTERTQSTSVRPAPAVQLDSDVDWTGRRGSRAEAMALIFDHAVATGEGFNHTVVGKPRFGKTYHARDVVDEVITRELADVAIVHDAKKTTPQYGIDERTGNPRPGFAIRSSLRHLAEEEPDPEEAVIVIHPDPYVHPSARETPEACAEAALLMARTEVPSLLVVDELYHALDAERHWRDPIVGHVIREGGSQGVSFVGTTQVPQALPDECFSLVQTIAIFRVDARGQDYLAKKLKLPDEVAAYLPHLKKGEFFLYTGNCDGVLYGPE